MSAFERKRDVRSWWKADVGRVSLSGLLNATLPRFYLRDGRVQEGVQVVLRPLPTLEQLGSIVRVDGSCLHYHGPLLRGEDDHLKAFPRRVAGKVEEPRRLTSPLAEQGRASIVNPLFDDAVDVAIPMHEDGMRRLSKFCN